ncbi:cytochrome P450 [Syncephalis fuscata]|nr:cytochrome P450 [Syncephalis fuscata]
MLATLFLLISAVPWLGVAAVLAAGYILRMLYEQEYKNPLSKVPGPRFSAFNVLWTNFQQLYTEDPAIALDLHKRYGPIVRIGPNEVWVSGVTMIRKILGSYQFKKSFHYEAFRTEGNSLFTTNDAEQHRLQKRLMLPAYTTNSLSELESLIYDVGISRLVARLRRHADAGDTVDMMDMFQRLAFEIIGEVSFGKSLELFEEKKTLHPIMKWINGATTYSALKMLLGPLFRPSYFPESTQCVEDLSIFSKQAIEKRRKYGGHRRKDSLQKLIDAVDEETGATMSDQDLVAQSIMLMVAGTDTTASTLTWTLLLLIEHPECARRLVEEIKALYPDPDTKITYEDVQSLPYLDAVLNESMRIRPIAPHGMPRVVPEGGITMGGYFLPAGTTVFSSFNALHLNEHVFPDPDVFKPERWLTSPDQLAIMKQHFVPFSMGPRACIGRNLAWMEMRMAIFELMRHFTFVASPENDTKPVDHFVLRPRGGKYLVRPYRA